MTTGKRWLVWGIVAVVVLGAAGAGIAVAAKNNRKVAVQIGKAAKRDLASIVTASGEIRPRRYVNIGSNVSGKIVHLTVREGDKVKKGQILARIESERYEASTRQSEAAVQAAQSDFDRSAADLDVSKMSFDRTRRMYEEKLVSSQVYDEAEAEVKMKAAALQATRRRVAQVQAQLDSTRDDLSKTTVVSTMDGVVTSLPKEEGEVVIGAQSFSPTVIMTVADLSVMECEIMVDETDIRSVQLGQPAEVRVDALEGVKIKGDVTEIGSSAIVRGSTASQTAQTSSAGSTANQAKDFKVTITLKDPPSALRPGVNATADITTATRKDVLSVAIQAVVVRQVDKDGKVVEPDAAPSPAAGGNNNTQVQTKKERLEEKDGVFVVEGGVATFKTVKTGIMGETEVEILDGLKEGQEVVTGSFKTLRSLKDKAQIKPEIKKGRA